MMKRKGQAESIVIFFLLIVSIFIVSIIVLNLVNTIITPFQHQISNVSVQAGQAVSYTQSRFTAFWDYAVVLLLFINILILLISSFLIDVHPVFVVIYVLSVIFLFIFGNQALYVLDRVWDVFAPVGSLEASQSQLQIFIINHIQWFMIGIILLSGILMYAKVKFFGGSGTGGTY